MHAQEDGSTATAFSRDSAVILPIRTARLLLSDAIWVHRSSLRMILKSENKFLEFDADLQHSKVIGRRVVYRT